MRAVTLMYHDIVPEGLPDESGFPGPAAWRYKLSPVAFAEHLDAIAERIPEGPVRVTRLAAEGGRLPLLLTFDDGGSGAFRHAAGMLEAKGWRGHFLVAADRVGAPGFLTAAEIRDLASRGHVVGSHSMTHPMLMSRLPGDRLAAEWGESAARLGEILGEAVTVASIPGGYYSRRVAEAAAAAGFAFLFTSEPTCRIIVVDGCAVLGRCTVRRGMPAERAAALASGAVLPRLAQGIGWNARKLAKAVGGKAYLAVRGRLLGGERR